MPGLLIVRHAQSAWNSQGRWQGQADPPLSAFGEQQARVAAARLAAYRSSGADGFDLVVTSDLTRARRTGELLGQSCRHVIEPLLREYDVGEWSGLTREEIEERWPGMLSRFDAAQIGSPPGGEDRADFDRRVERASRAIGSLAGRRGAGRLLVVAHGGVIRSLARAAGLVEHHIGFLAGYWGEHATGALLPRDPVNLLEEGDPRGRHRPEVPSAM